MTVPDRRRFLQQSTAAALLATPVGQLLAAPIAGRRIRVGQIGVAHAHATKLSVYRRSPDYEVVGIAEDDLTLRQQAMAQPAFRDLTWLTREQLLATDPLDVVLVETAVSDLLVTAEQCIAAGKHIHLDKPAGESLPHFRRLMSQATQRGLMVQMGYMYRYNPGVVLLRDLLARGWLGEIFEVHAVMSKVIGAADRAELARYPGGTMFELGGHLMDLVVQVLGKPAQVTAYPRHSSTTIQDSLMDNMLAVLEYERALATVKSSALEVEGFERRHLVVCGTAGTLQIEPLDEPKIRLALDQPRGEYAAGYQEVRLPKYERYVADAADMARVLRGEKEFAFSPEHDLAVQESLLLASGLPIDR